MYVSFHRHVQISSWCSSLLVALRSDPQTWSKSCANLKSLGVRLNSLVHVWKRVAFSLFSMFLLFIEQSSFNVLSLIMPRKKLTEKEKRNRKNEITRVRRAAAQAAYIVSFSDTSTASQAPSVNSDLDTVVEAIATASTPHSSRYNNLVVSQFHSRPTTPPSSLFSLKSAAANLTDQKKTLTKVKQDEKKDGICLSPSNPWFVYTDPIS